MPRPEAAAEINLSTRTLERLDAAGEGPPTIRVGAKVLYPRSLLHTWMRSRTNGGQKVLA